MQDNGVVIVGGGSGSIDPSLMRQLNGSFFRGADKRFLFVLIGSLALHVGFALYFHSMKVEEPKPARIEQMPERFAKLIVEKPIPKPTQTAPKTRQETASETAHKTESSQAEETTASKTATTTAKAKKQAQKRVADRVARVEKKVRTVGVLNMLTGVGSTAKGPAVVDVLGKRPKESFQDLEKALEGMHGTVRAKDIDITKSKLVKSKDVKMSRREEIDDLIAGIGAAKTNQLSKRGAFVVQRPESIEGAASANAKRDNTAINKIVSANKVSIRMCYEKYLREDPSLAGKITVRFTILASGAVGRVQILENTTGNSKLEREIIMRVKMWRFEPIPNGDATVTYPFVFTPA